MKRSPLVVALLWAVGVAIVIGAGNKWVAEVEPNWIGVGFMSLVAFVLSFDAQRRRNAGSDPWISSRFGNSPEKTALVSGVFVGGFMLLWGFAAQRSIRDSAWPAAFLGAYWFLMMREDTYLKRGVRDYPIRWLTVDRVLWAMAISLLLYIVMGAIVQPETFRRGDLMLAVPGFGFAVGLSWLRRRQRAKLLREARGSATGGDS